MILTTEYFVIKTDLWIFRSIPKKHKGNLVERIKANSSLAISPQLLIGGAGVGGRDKALPLGKFFLIISLGAKTVTKLRKIY